MSSMSNDTNGNNVTNLRFPLQIVASIVAACLSSALTIMATNYSMRSDIRDLTTRMAFYEENQRKLEYRIEKENLEVKQTNEATRKEVLAELKLLSFRLEELKMSALSGNTDNLKH